MDYHSEERAWAEPLELLIEVLGPFRLYILGQLLLEIEPSEPLVFYVLDCDTFQEAVPSVNQRGFKHLSLRDVASVEQPAGASSE